MSVEQHEQSGTSRAARTIPVGQVVKPTEHDRLREQEAAYLERFRKDVERAWGR
jgi:hypothetical protein